MIYTTYYSMLRHLPSNITPISIAQSTPKFYNGLVFKELAPDISYLRMYKYNNDEVAYTYSFNKLLSKLNANEIVSKLFALANNTDIALVCYEKPSSFCHRHLVAKWLNDNGIECEEFKKEN